MPRETGEVTLADMAASALRELKMRKKVYPRLVKDEKMTAEDAVWERECMNKIYRWLKEQPVEVLVPSEAQLNLLPEREQYHE